MLPTLPDLEVQVISGGITGGADIADDLALLHFLPNGHADGGTMGIQSVISIVVLHLDVVPIPAAPGVDGVGYGDGPIRCRKNGRSFRRSDVGSAVIGNFSSKGVLTVSKP